jgi:hypothetical protein
MFHEVSPVSGISAWWIVDPRRLFDPAWAAFLFNALCGGLRLGFPVEADRSGGMVRFGTSLLYVGQMTAK